MSVLYYVKWLAMGQHEPFWWNFHWNGMRWLADWLVDWLAKANGSYGSLPAGIVSEASLTVWFGKPKVLPFEFGLSWMFCGSFWEFNDIHVAFHTKKSYSTSITIFDTMFYSASHKNHHSIEERRRSGKKVLKRRERERDRGKSTHIQKSNVQMPLYIIRSCQRWALAKKRTPLIFTPRKKSFSFFLFSAFFIILFFCFEN